MIKRRAAPPAAAPAALPQPRAARPRFAASGLPRFARAAAPAPGVSRWEAEARRVSEQAVRSVPHRITAPSTARGPRPLGPGPSRSPAGPGLARRVVPTVTPAGLPGAGQLLSVGQRRQLEPLVGADLGAVRLHTGPAAHAAAEQQQARAFTAGNHIVFHDDHDPANLALLAHEVAHTVQQSATLHAAHPRGPPGRPSNLTLSSAPAGLIQRLPLQPWLGDAPVHLSLLLPPRLAAIVYQLDANLGLELVMSRLSTQARTTVVGRFPLLPGHFTPTLDWFEAARPQQRRMEEAERIAAADDAQLPRALRSFGTALRALFGPGWRRFSEALAATRQTCAWFNGQLPDTFAGLGAAAGFSGLGLAVDDLGSTLNASAGQLDRNAPLRAFVADALGCDQPVRTTAELVSWVDRQRTTYLTGTRRLRQLAADLQLPLDFLEPLDTVAEFGRSAATLDDVFVEVADVLDDPDLVTDDAYLFSILLPRLRQHLVLLPEVIGDLAMWPGAYASSLHDGVRAFVGTLQHWGERRLDWLLSAAQRIHSWVGDIFDRTVERFVRLLRSDSTWLGTIEQTFVAMEPAMADEDTKEIKPSLLIRALRKLGVPEELLAKLQQATRALGQAVKHPFRFFKNVARAIVGGLHRFVGNIGGHVMNSILDWIFGELDLRPPESFSLPKILGWLATLIRLTFDHFLTVLERKHPGVGERVRRALRAGAIAIRWIRLLFEGNYAELWEELKAYLYNFWSEFIMRVQKLLLDDLLARGLDLLVGFLTPGVRQAVHIVREIYRVIKKLQAQSQRLLAVVSSVCDYVIDLVEGKLERAIAKVEELAVKVLRFAIRFIANWAGLDDVPKKIRSALDVVRELVDRAFSKLIDLGGKVWEWLKEKYREAVEWWQNRSLFENAAGERHELSFTPPEKGNALIVESTPRVLEDYLKQTVPSPTAEEQAILKDIRAHAKTIDQIKAKTKGSFGQRDGEAIRVEFVAIAKLLAKLGRAEKVPPTKVKWATLSGKYNDGVHMTAAPLSLDPGTLSGSQPYQESVLWKAVNRRSGVYIRGHLLNHHLHGPGSITNMIPITRSANTAMEKKAESTVKHAVVSQKLVVQYDVIADFPKSKPKRKYIPEEADLPNQILLQAYPMKKRGSEWVTDFSATPIVNEPIPSVLPPDTAP